VSLLVGLVSPLVGVYLLVRRLVFMGVALLLFLFRKEFLLVSFDREMAVTLKKNTLFWDALLFLLIGLTISMSVLSVGPLVVFGFLLLPPLTAQLFAANMRQLTVIASLLGGAAALGGFHLAYRCDLPVGPTDVMLLGVVYALAFLTQKIHGLATWRANCECNIRTRFSCLGRDDGSRLAPW